MRSDMSNVIVERPRLRVPLKNGSAYPRGHLENRWAPDLEDAPRTESLGGTYRVKRLNENLQPLVRFLRSRVGQPWDDVHSEIAAQISCKSAVQKHVLDHLRDYVAENVRVVGKTIHHIEYRAGRLESRGMRLRFYVDPVSRRLCLAPLAPRKRRVVNGADPDRRVLSPRRELRRIGGVWFEIEIAPIPGRPSARAACFDVVERAALDGGDNGVGARVSPLWQTARYATRKRQLGKREITRFGLRRSP